MCVYAAAYSTTAMKAQNTLLINSMLVITTSISLSLFPEYSALFKVLRWIFFHYILYRKLMRQLWLSHFIHEKTEAQRFQLRWGEVRLQSSCSWLFYSSLLSCERGHSRYYSSWKGRASQREKQNCECRVQVVMRRPWTPSLCLIKEFTLNFKDSWRGMWKRRDSSTISAL